MNSEERKAKIAEIYQLEKEMKKAYNDKDKVLFDAKNNERKIKVSELNQLNKAS